MCFFLINKLGCIKSLSPHVLKCCGMRCSFGTTKRPQIANLMIKRDKKKEEEKGEWMVVPFAKVNSSEKDQMEGRSRLRNGRLELNTLQWDVQWHARGMLSRQLDLGLRRQIWAKDINLRLVSEYLVDCSYGYGKTAQNKAWNRGRRSMVSPDGLHWWGKVEQKTERKWSRRSQWLFQDTIEESTLEGRGKIIAIFIF